MSELDRRDLLKAALVGGAGLATMAGCVREGAPKAALHVGSLADSLDPAAAEAVLKKMDRRLAWIEKQTLPEEILPASVLKEADEETLRQHTSLIKKTISSLYVTGRFLDLPDELKTHPGIQERILTAQPDMDDAVSQLTSVLEKMTPKEHQRVRGFLRKETKFGERLAEFLETPAKEDGLPFKRHFSLRSGILQLSARMAAQSPALLTDVLVRKVRRMEARSNEEQEQLLKAKVGEEVYTRHQKKLAALQEAWATRLGMTAQPVVTQPQSNPVYPQTIPTSQPMMVEAYTPPQNEPAQNEPLASAEPSPEVAAPPAPPISKGRAMLGRGGRIMGFGAGAVGAGAVFAGLGELLAIEAFFYPAIVLGITVGPILLSVGLIVVIAGAIMMAQEKKSSTYPI